MKDIFFSIVLILAAILVYWFWYSCERLIILNINVNSQKHYK